MHIKVESILNKTKRKGLQKVLTENYVEDHVILQGEGGFSENTFLNHIFNCEIGSGAVIRTNRLLWSV